jgi:tetratricopeptide (TPR) repeat protein
MDINSQTLSALEDQRHLLQLLVWIGAAIAVAAFARLALAVYSTRRQMRSEGFSSIAAPLYMERRFDQLAQICRERIAAQPLDPNPHYYLGLCFFEQGQLGESAPHFERALELSPTWGPQVQPYLQRVRGANGA